MAEQTPPAPVAFTGLRVFSRIVLALMVVSMLYVAWLSLSYWPEIRV
jgi:hypothetical protein